MSKNRNRAKQKQEDRFIANDWKCAIRDGIHRLFLMDALELDLAKALHHFSPDDLEIADIQCQLALLYHEFGDFKGAVHAMEEALVGYWIQLDFDNAFLVECRRILSKMYWDVGQYDEASKELEEVLFVIGHNEDSAYPSIWIVLRELAQSYLYAGKNLQAIELFDELLELDQIIKGASSAGLITPLLDLAKALRKAGLVVNSLELLNQTLEINLATLPKHHPDITKAKWEQALNYEELGCYKEALRLSEEVLVAEVKDHGSLHIEFAHTLDFQAKQLSQLGKWEESRGKLEAAYHLFCRLLGGEDAYTQEVKGRLEGD